MGEPVNLNRFKKQKARAENKARADQNAILHGLSKSERESAKTNVEKAAHKLDGIERHKDTSN